jgi:hypothetical protein
MELATLTMDRTEARKKFLEYKHGVKDRQDAEMKQIMDGYKAVANGHQVIDIVATIRKGGSSKHKSRWSAEMVSLPNLAIMRADQPWCWANVGSDGHVVFANEDRVASNARRNVVRLPKGTVDDPPQWGVQARAMVPPVPPGLQPKFGLGNYHILWEAEWEMVAPKDPALLKHIGGDLYAVLATWDLTEIERTVLAGRFR